MIKVHGGFFWAQPNGAIQIDVREARNCVIENCVFMGRPKWYQLIKWYRGLRLWLSVGT